MKKEIQLQYNKICENAYENAMKEWNDFSIKMYSKKLRNCQAEVYESENYIFLKSYSTIVAFIDKKESTLFDVLRFVYGYTATSAQHIAKFKSDYFSICDYRWNYA